MAEIKVILKKNNNTDYEIDRFNGLNSVESISESTQNPTSLNSGIVSNTGSLSLYDVNGEIARMISNNELNLENLSARISLNGKNSQFHIIKDAVYNEETVFNSNLSNALSSFGLVYYNSSNQIIYTTMYGLLKDCLNTCGFSDIEIDSMLTENIVYGFTDNIYGTIKDFLLSIHIGPVLYTNILARDLINTICEACRLNFVARDDGSYMFISNRIKHSLQNETIIEIPTSKQYSKLKYNLIPENKIQSIKLQQYSNTTEKIYTPSSLSDVSEDGKYIFIVSPTMKFNLFDDPDNLPDNYTFEKFTDNNGDNWGIFTFNACGRIEQRLKNINILSTPKINCFLRYNSGVTTDFTDKDSNYIEHYDNINSFKNAINTFVSTSSGVIFGGTSNNTTNDIFNDYATYFIAVRYDTNGTYLGDFKFFIGSPISKITYGNNEPESLVVGNSSLVNNITIDNKLFLDSTEYVEGNVGTNFGILISNNILSEYETGVRSAKITVSCGDFYNIDNNLVKNWGNGDVLQIGEFVKILSKSTRSSPIINTYWRITGRKFRYNGCPYIDLELQEVKKAPNIYTVDFISEGSLYSEQLVTEGTTVTRPAQNPTKVGFEFDNWYTDTTYSTVFNFSTPITENTTIYAKFEPVQITATFDISNATSLTMYRNSSYKTGATIGTITTSTPIYYNDNITFTVNTSETLTPSQGDLIGIKLIDSLGNHGNTSTTKPLSYSYTMKWDCSISTYVQKWVNIYTIQPDVWYEMGEAGQWYNRTFTLTNYVDQQGYGSDMKADGAMDFFEVDTTSARTYWKFEFGVSRPSNTLESTGNFGEYMGLEMETSFDTYIDASQYYNQNNNVRVKLAFNPTTGVLTLSNYYQNGEKGMLLRRGSDSRPVTIYQYKKI